MGGCGGRVRCGGGEVELGNAERGDGEVRLLWVVKDVESRAMAKSRANASKTKSDQKQQQQQLIL